LFDQRTPFGKRLTVEQIVICQGKQANGLKVSHRKTFPQPKLIESIFVQDLPQYRDMVSQFYADIARLPQISDQEMGTSMQQLSIQQNDEFDTIAALKELYIYVTTYKEQVRNRG
jgi:Plexin cytoplasmic RasGAP domain